MKNQDKTYSDIEDELKALRKEYNHLKILQTKDNSERILLEDSLAETVSRLRLALVGGNMAWWEMEVTTGSVIFDKHKVEMLDYAPENFKHYTDFTSLVHPDDYKRIMYAMSDHLNGTKNKYEAEYRIRAKSGEYIWFYDYGSVVKRDANGKPLICSGFVFNITERKNAEKRMAYIVKAVESTSDAIAISDNQGHHFYQNKAFSDLFGYETPEEHEASGGGKATIKDPEITKELFSNIMSGKSWSGELEMVTKSGRVFPAYESANAIKDASGNLLGTIGIIKDITERKQHEEALVKNKNKLQAVLDHFPGVVFWKDRKSIYQGCNITFALGAGLKSSSEIIGKTDFDLPWGDVEGEHYRADDAGVMESGKPKLHIVETQHQSNGKIVWLDTNKVPLRDKQGEVMGVIGVSSDITILKSAERELILANEELIFQIEEKEKRATELIIAKEKAEESDRLKTAFLNNISHEIRTPFNGILGFLSILQDDDVSKSEREEYTEFINQSADRLMNSINEIVEMSLIQAEKIEFTSFKTNIDNLIEVLRAQFMVYAKSKKIEFLIINNLTKDQTKLSTDIIKLKTILSNLIDNAFKFTNNGSVELVICKKDAYLEFSVKDTGIGIPENKLEVIFDRFMQTDVSKTREFEGLGLGLTIAKSYVEMLGGKIRVESEVGKGSTFYFTIRL